MPIPIIYEDNHLLIVEKPINMPVQEDASGDLDLLSALKAFIKERDHKPGNVYLALLHRLDRPVGGVMAFGKTSKAASRLSDDFRRHKVKRDYLAVVQDQNLTLKNQETWTDYLYKNRQKNKVSVVNKADKRGKKAVLDYQLLEQRKQVALVRVRLHTGRSHQIRVQFQSREHPLWGGQKYGQKYSHKGQQIALWAQHLSLIHPTKKETMTFTSTPPLSKEPWNVFKDQFTTDEDWYFMT